MRSRLIFLTILFVGILAPAESQLVDGKKIVTPSLNLSSSDITRPFTVLLRFEIESRWHLYWINPGDAGLPPAVQWDLPTGIAAGPLMFPTPEKIVEDGITAYGYAHEVVLLCRMTPDPDLVLGKDAQLTARLDWLVCRESCLRAGDTLTVGLDEESRNQLAVSPDALRRFEDRLPRPLSDVDIVPQRVSVDRGDSRWRIEVPLSGSDTKKVLDFFPDTLSDFSIDFASVGVSKGSIGLEIQPYSPSAKLEHVSGIIMVGGTGYELDVTVPAESFR